MIKRIMDVFASLVALVLLAPVFILICVAIKIDSRGPVFFAQHRVGRNEKLFRILKFRTMKDRDPDLIDQRSEKPVSSNQDPRITQVGRVLRMTSLDELPQLINILRGEMSLVGPRPVIPEQIQAIPPGYRKRALVKPGLTGLSQVRGRRNLDWLLQLAYDREYVEKESIWLDVRIILTTAWQVIMRRGIYGSPGQNWRGYLNDLSGKLPSDLDVQEALRRQTKAEPNE